VALRYKAHHRPHETHSSFLGNAINTVQEFKELPSGTQFHNKMDIFVIFKDILKTIWQPLSLHVQLQSGQGLAMTDRQNHAITCD
jgi:hypothetical protein